MVEASGGFFPSLNSRNVTTLSGEEESLTESIGGMRLHRMSCKLREWIWNCPRMSVLLRPSQCEVTLSLPRNGLSYLGMAEGSFAKSSAFLQRFSKGCVTLALAIDIKGTFHIVRPMILKEKLRVFEAPQHIVNFVASLIERREVYFSNSERSRTCGVGVSQGSLVALIV